jgi:Cys-rich protein (TIGR01571 family)
MGAQLSSLQRCESAHDLSDFARNNADFTWKDEFRSIGVLNAVVDKGHLVQEAKSVEVVGKFFSGFAADAHGAKLAATKEVYSLLILHCFRFATNPESVESLGNAVNYVVKNCIEARTLFATTETVNAINAAFTTYATTDGSAAVLGKIIASIASDANQTGKRLFCTAAIRSSLSNALNKYASTLDDFKALCSAVTALCTDFKPGKKLFACEDFSALVDNLLATHSGDPERVKELLSVVGVILTDFAPAQELFITSRTATAVSSAFDRATTAAHLATLTEGLLKVIYIHETAATTLMTSSVVESFTRRLMAAGASSEASNNNNNGAEEASTFSWHASRFSGTTTTAGVSAVCVPLQKLLAANPVGIKAFAASTELLDELKRIEDFSNASDPATIRAVRQLRLLFFTDTWSGYFLLSCFTDTGAYCEYAFCRMCTMEGSFGSSSLDVPCDGCCSMSMLLWMSMTALPPVPCMMIESVLFRRAMKAKYNIRESAWCYVPTCLCPCNAMAQHFRELQRRGDADRDGCCTDPSTQVDPCDPVLVAHNGPVRARPAVLEMGENDRHHLNDGKTTTTTANNRRSVLNADDDDNYNYNASEMTSSSYPLPNYNEDNRAAVIATMRAERQNGVVAASTYDNRANADEAQQTAALQHALPPIFCFLREVPLHLSFRECVAALLSLRELPTNENGAVARPDLQNWIPTAADVDRFVRFIERQLPSVKGRETVQRLIATCRLTDDDIRALILYKIQHPYPVYKWLNAWLTQQRRDNKIAQTAGPIFTRIYRAMEKLPKVTLAASRAVIVGEIPALRATFDNYKTRCAPGKSMSFWGFSSFSLQNSPGSSYFAGAPDQEAIIYTCDELQGVSMEEWKPDGMANESEILPMCPSVFEIVSAQKVGAKLIIKMKQLDHEEFSYVEPSLSSA